MVRSARAAEGAVRARAERRPIGARTWRSEKETSGEVTAIAEALAVPMPCVFSAETYSSSPTEPLLSTVPSSAAGSETLVPSIWMGAAVSAAGGRACTVMFRLAERAERSTIATAAVMLAPPAAAELAESAAAGRNKLESAASSASSPASNFVASDSVAARTRATVCWYVATALAAGVAAPAVSASEMAAWKPARPALMSESSSAEVWPSPSSTSGTASSTCAVQIGGKSEAGSHISGEVR